MSWTKSVTSGYEIQELYKPNIVENFGIFQNVDAENFGKLKAANLMAVKLTDVTKTSKHALFLGFRQNEKTAQTSFK